MLISALGDGQEDIRVRAILILGAATQSNPPVQNAAIDLGAVESIMSILKTASNSIVRRRAIFCLSSLIRHSPRGQAIFFRNAGIEVLSLVLAVNNEALQLKAINLLLDLHAELQDALSEPETCMSGSPAHASEGCVQRYLPLTLIEEVIERGWCDTVSNLLYSQRYSTRVTAKEAASVLMGFPKCRFLAAEGGYLSTVQEIELNELMEQAQQSDGGAEPAV
eukprot:Colp12_sorted_trinity150504_noHs@32346